MIAADSVHLQVWPVFQWLLKDRWIEAVQSSNLPSINSRVLYMCWACRRVLPGWHADSASTGRCPEFRTAVQGTCSTLGPSG